MSDSIDSEPEVTRRKTFITYPLSSLMMLVLAIAIALGWWSIERGFKINQQQGNTIPMAPSMFLMNSA